MSDAARTWLESAPVIYCGESEPTACDCSAGGIHTRGTCRRLVSAQSVLEGFSAEFLSGMTGQESRSRRLGMWRQIHRNPGNGVGRELFRILLLMLYAQPKASSTDGSKTIQGIRVGYGVRNFGLPANVEPGRQRALWV